MKKHDIKLLYLLLTLLLSVAMTACGDDKDEPGGENNSSYTERLVGNWKFSSGTETVAGYTFDFTASQLNSMKRDLESATGQSITIWDETLSFTTKKVNGVNYKVKGIELLLDGIEKSDGLKITIKRLDAATLVLHEDFSQMVGETFVADMEYKKQ